MKMDKHLNTPRTNISNVWVRDLVDQWNTTMTDNFTTSIEYDADARPTVQQYSWNYDPILICIKTFNYTLGISGSLLNILTLTALLRQKGHLKLRLILIGSLAMSDLLIALLSTVYYDYCFHDYWNLISLGRSSCFRYKESLLNSCLKVIMTDVYTVAQYAGLSTMFAISIDLLYAVRKPFKYRQLSTGNIGYKIVGFLWGIPSVAQLVVSSVLSYPLLMPGFNYRPPFSEISGWLFLPISTLSVVPFVIIYCCIVCNLRHQFAMAPTDQSRNLRKIGWTVLLILGTYVICMLPLVWILIYISTESSETHGRPNFFVAMSTLRLLYMSNTLWDPVIFSVRIPEIRKEIKRIWRAVLCCKYQAVSSLRNGNASSEGNLQVTYV